MGTDGLVVEYGGDTFSCYDVDYFSPGVRKLDNVMSPRLFATQYRPAQVEVFALGEALGERAWLRALSLKALSLEGYAVRL